MVSAGGNAAKAGNATTLDKDGLFAGAFTAMTSGLAKFKRVE
jgi:hypothetical protein